MALLSPKRLCLSLRTAEQSDCAAQLLSRSGAAEAVACANRDQIRKRLAGGPREGTRYKDAMGDWADTLESFMSAHCATPITFQPANSRSAHLATEAAECYLHGEACALSANLMAVAVVLAKCRDIGPPHAFGSKKSFGETSASSTNYRTRLPIHKLWPTRSRTCFPVEFRGVKWPMSGKVVEFLLLPCLFNLLILEDRYGGDLAEIERAEQDRWDSEEKGWDHYPVYDDE